VRARAEQRIDDRADGIFDEHDVNLEEAESPRDLAVGEVEYIISEHKKRGGLRDYLVKFKGYEQPELVLADPIDEDAPEHVAWFREKKKRRQKRRRAQAKRRRDPAWRMGRR